MTSDQPGFFANFARNLQRTEILLIGLLIEKGAATRGVVLREAKLVTFTGIPAHTIERSLLRLVFLQLIRRQRSGRNYEYRVLLENFRKVKEPTFPDRTSLSAQLSFEGFGRLPSRIRVPDQEKPIQLETATLDVLRQVRAVMVQRSQHRTPRNERLEQLDKLISMVELHQGNNANITVAQVLKLRHAELALVTSAH
jgi:hypothetical protein